MERNYSEELMAVKNLRAQRAAAGIPGHAVCQFAGISRAKLSDIEREYVTATPEELQRIAGAIEQILLTWQHLPKLATDAGMSLTGVRL
jgi:transcriptional regulator with XRE-family HTH domain